MLSTRIYVYVIYMYYAYVICTFYAYVIYMYLDFFSFFAGLTMYKILPRHQFSAVQMVLFPKYFSYNLLFCSLSLSSFYLLINKGLTAERMVYKVSGIFTPSHCKSS